MLRCCWWMGLWGALRPALVSSARITFGHISLHWYGTVPSWFTSSLHCHRRGERPQHCGRLRMGLHCDGQARAAARAVGRRASMRSWRAALASSSWPSLSPNWTPALSRRRALAQPVHHSATHAKPCTLLSAFHQVYACARNAPSPVYQPGTLQYPCTKM